MIVSDKLLAKLDNSIDSVTLNQVRHTLNNLAPPDIAHQLEIALQNIAIFSGNWSNRRFLVKYFKTYPMTYN